MKKMETIFMRDDRGRALPKANPEVLWVFDGLGVATRKWDGTACMVRDGVLYKRSEWSESKGPAPADWMHWSRDPAMRHGHGWLPINDRSEDWMHREAWATGLDNRGFAFTDGTYELIGPRIGKNPERATVPVLVRHGVDVLDAPRDFDGLHAYLEAHSMEGIVWHLDEFTMAKIKRRDFGIPWPLRVESQPLTRSEEGEGDKS